ncbi:MAG TPA: VWA domain-containing protein [Nitrospirae bacterium]|nr:VWA domain-containing protein [Nitrospirota bacterium]
MIDEYCRKTTAGVLKLLRNYPSATIRIGSRAGLAMYETMAALIVMGADNPALCSALITLTHRISCDSVVDYEKIVRDSVEEYLNPGAGEYQYDDDTDGLPISKVSRILKELNNLQDMIHAMPYEIDILDPTWFKISRDTLFRPEAPTLLALTVKDGGDPDFSKYKNIMSNLEKHGLTRLENGEVKLTRKGSAVRFKDVFNIIERKHLHAIRKKRRDDPLSSDSRKYRNSDSYKSVHVRRTLRNIVKKQINLQDISSADLRVENSSVNREFQLAVAVDHSWSMGRSRKLQSAKDAAAGLVFAARKNGDKIALIGFSDTASIHSPLSKKYSALIDKINRFRPDYETNIADALVKASAVFNRSKSGGIKHLVIISDGIPTTQTGFENAGSLTRTIAGEIGKMRKMGVTISVICIRDELEENDSAQAREIASLGRGAFKLVDSAELMRKTVEDYSSVRQ